MALAVWLHAANSMLTATTMPSAIEEVGGLNLISWTFSLYLVGSIVAGAVSSILVDQYGLRQTMIRAALLYGAGCVVCALAPSMPVILLGRVMQGLGGGVWLPWSIFLRIGFFRTILFPKSSPAYQLSGCCPHFVDR
jgi:MFS family permease